MFRICKKDFIKLGDIMTQRYVVVDIETTGNAAKKGDRIIQFSAVVIENNQIMNQYSSFVNPGVSVPIFIEELTGINDDMVKNAPTFTEIAPKIAQLLENSIFVAHNVLFDLPFLQEEFTNAGVERFYGKSIDTVELAKIMLPTSDSFKLGDLAERLSLSHIKPHQADSDAYVTAELLLLFKKRIEALPLVTLEKLTILSQHLKSDVSLLFQEALEQNRQHIEKLPEQLEVYRGIALRKKIYRSNTSSTRLLSDYPKSHKEKDELLMSMFSHYESRDGQCRMMDVVYDSFQHSKVAVIEAGTGVGKSLGYLLPSVFFAIKEQKPVLISTYTVQLQHQLMRKEIKALQHILEFPINAVLLKGRSHYLNLFKFEQSLTEHDQNYDSVLAKMQILIWLTLTITGDVDELNLSTGGRTYWQRIKQDGWHLANKQDPWKTRDFYQYAKQQALNADIVVTNHAMLFSEMANQSDVYAEFQYLVIDEAHHLERTAREYFGDKIIYNRIKFLISKLGIYDQKQMFYQLENILETHGIHGSPHAFEFESYLKSLDADIDDLFLMLAQYLQKQKHHSKGYQKVKIRIKKDILDSKNWNSIKWCAERISTSLTDVDKALRSRLKDLEEKKVQLNDKEQAFIEELYSFLNDWKQVKQEIRALYYEDDHLPEVLWLEGDLRALPTSISIQRQPIYVADSLQRELFSNKKSVILTSATLTINSSFQFFLNEIGYSASAIRTEQIASPFPYEKNTKFIIPNDLPDISQVDSMEFSEQVASHLIAIAQATKGRMLVLFTSYELLKNIYQLMKDSGTLDDFLLIAQGVTAGSRSRLTKNFQKFEKAILFGTNSFWEGVDIPGENLSCLVMVRLPFLPPDEPVIEAKSEYLRSLGKNPFSAYSLPEAVIRFKQGFGRLIRQKTDRGIFLILDRRIETTKYGQAFIQSIPNMKIEHQSLNETIELIEKWL